MENTDRSDSQLDALGVVHYIVAGFLGLFGLLPLLHVAIGVGVLNGRLPFSGTANAPPGFPPAVFGWFFIVFGLLFITLRRRANRLPSRATIRGRDYFDMQISDRPCWLCNR